ncbi:MAG TPA: ROK family protein [Candidatus Sumerlaeota bacterium]|nr:ROK family protein [Candidatus Sumerlaeota bacterium]
MRHKNTIGNIGNVREYNDDTEEFLKRKREGTFALYSSFKPSGDQPEAIQQLIMFFDPQLVVLGGGLTAVGDALAAPIYRSLAERAAVSTTFAEMYAPEKVRLTALGTDVAILGAAALVASS